MTTRLHRAALKALLLTLLGGAGTAAEAAQFDLATATFDDIQAAIAAGRLSSEKLVDLYEARIAAYDRSGPQIGSVIALNPDARTQARALDAERKAKGARGPLHGIPVVLKDNIDTFDLPTTGGSFVLAGARPAADAPVVRRLRDAGAIILAKVNLDDFAAGGAGFSTISGQTRNPWNPAYTPLGSSGGSGAAVATWFAPLALGTDTGGSLRSPTSVSAIYGLKPTRGLLPRTGIIPTCYTFDAVGPMARSVRDLALSLGVMTGIDQEDRDTSASVGLAYRDYGAFTRLRRLDGVRIGVLADGSRADAEVDALFDAAVARLRSLGATVVGPVRLPPQVREGATRRAVVQVVCDTEKSVYFASYLAGLGAAYPKTLAELAERGLALTAPQGAFAPYPVIYQGLANRVKTWQGLDSLAYRSAKEHGIAMVTSGLMGVFEEQQVDVLVYPTRPLRPHLINPEEPLTGRAVPAPPAGGTSVGVGLTNIANITGFPELVAPAGFTSAEHMPVSISFLGPAFSEPRLLAFASAYEAALPRLPVPERTPRLAGETFRY
jgi:amidase